MKKLLAFTAALCLLAAVGCGSKTENSDSTPEVSVSSEGDIAAADDDLYPDESGYEIRVGDFSCRVSDKLKQRKDEYNEFYYDGENVHITIYDELYPGRMTRECFYKYGEEVVSSYTGTVVSEELINGTDVIVKSSVDLAGMPVKQYYLFCDDHSFQVNAFFNEPNREFVEKTVRNIIASARLENIPEYVFGINSEKEGMTIAADDIWMDIDRNSYDFTYIRYACAENLAQLGTEIHISPVDYEGSPTGTPRERADRFYNDLFGDKYWMASGEVNAPEELDCFGTRVCRVEYDGYDTSGLAAYCASYFFEAEGRPYELTVIISRYDGYEDVMADVDKLFEGISVKQGF